MEGVVTRIARGSERVEGKAVIRTLMEGRVEKKVNFAILTGMD